MLKFTIFHVLFYFWFFPRKFEYPFFRSLFPSCRSWESDGDSDFLDSGLKRSELGRFWTRTVGKRRTGAERERGRNRTSANQGSGGVVSSFYFLCKRVNAKLDSLHLNF